ncbi:MAG: hypothetical protein KAR07_04710, partial [Spirochaetes bacterium]|nr:hypothetical protein [Spirochaetota bacterium]
LFFERLSLSGSQAGSPGFGLYGCAEIAKTSGGELIIISRDKKLQKAHNCEDFLFYAHKLSSYMVVERLPQTAYSVMVYIYNNMLR